MRPVVWGFASPTVMTAVTAGFGSTRTFAYRLPRAVVNQQILLTVVVANARYSFGWGQAGAGAIELCLQVELSNQAQSLQHERS